mmetsp:Transcript_18112/g.48242  ORF Transcript_18112/g.48242 Transcript_18112/m.48242 type:complete len:268 (+) Transcript_18112:240-1043(+)
MEYNVDSLCRALATNWLWCSASKCIFSSSARFSASKLSAMSFSLENRFPSCLLLERTCSVLAIRSWKLVMAMVFFLWSASISESRVCASRSCSRRDLPSPEPSSSGPACVDIPATNACIDHCAFSMSLRTASSWPFSASKAACSFLATASFFSTCFWSSARADLPCFWLSIWASKSDSRFLSFDSDEATSFATLECSSSKRFSSFERWSSRFAVRSFISCWASFCLLFNALIASTKVLNVDSISSNCWFLFSKRCFTWTYSKAMTNL